MDKKIYLAVITVLALFSLSISYSHPQKWKQIKEPPRDVSVKNPSYEIGKGPIVMFDEGHHNMHTSTRSYKPFVEVIMNDGYILRVNKSEFTEDVLKGHDILVISNALNERNIAKKKPPHFSAFTEEEIEAVHEWVSDGGGLLLIADHAPWGGAAYDLAARFGVILSRGTVVFGKKISEEGKPDTPKKKVKKKRGALMVMATSFSRKSGLIVDHPITRGRNDEEKISNINTYLGQSLQVPEGAGFIKLSDNAYDKDPTTNEKRLVSGHFQAAGLAYGKGRVVVMGEAAMLTVRFYLRKDHQSKESVWESFGMDPRKNDNKQLLLNIMHYLSDLIEPGIETSSKHQNPK